MRVKFLSLTLFWYVIAFALIAAAAALNLQMPFVADQAVTLLGAKAIDAGGILYVDFWDNKMPGLYWFYLAGGKIFGFSEIGIHWLEGLWMLGFAITLMVLLRPYYKLDWISSIAALAVVGTYAVAAEPFQLTQIEVLIGFPVFLSAWCAMCIGNRARLIPLFGAASGICAGITVCFKLVYAPLFVCFWLIATFSLVSSGLRIVSRDVVGLWASASAGVGLVLLVVIAKFYADGALAELYWTAFAYPAAALQSAPSAPVYRLAGSVIFFASYFAVWSLLIFFALVDWWRYERTNVLTLTMICWLAVGFMLILIQKFSWWSYHFYLLFPPAGILAAKGIDVAATFISCEVPALRAKPILITLMLAIPGIGAMLLPASQKGFGYLEVFVRESGDVQLFREVINPAYAAIRKSTRFLKDDGARKGPIYVFGDPLYYYISNRRPAAPIVGWPWDFFLQSQLDDLPQHLERSRPPYIYITSRDAVSLNRREAAVRQFISAHYTDLFNDNRGTWYGAKPGSWGEVSPAKPSVKPAQR